jgi:predicted Fe-Mo cluster-binding NifX family protein
MKIAVTASGTSLDDPLDPRFGRCAYFLIVETDTMEFEVVENSSAELGGGAGIQSAKVVAGKGASYLLTGNCGPNAHRTLTAAGINVVVGCTGTVKEAVEKYKAGGLDVSDSANVSSHFGLGPGTE